MTELNDLEQIRFEKMKRLKEAGLEPYPPRVQRTHTAQTALAAFEAVSEDDTVSAVVTGRIRSHSRRFEETSKSHPENAIGSDAT